MSQLRTSVFFKKKTDAFSLVELVLALAIVAVAVPVMIALIGYFSRTSADVVNREEAYRAFSAVSLYLNGRQGDSSGTSASTTTTIPFSTVAGWVLAAQTTPQPNGKGQLLYAYKTPGSTIGYLVSQTAPTTAVDGMIMVAEIKPAVSNTPTTITSATTLTATAALATSGTVSANAKPYLPLEVALYAVSSSQQTAAWSAGTVTPTPIDTYPLVVNR